jgi:hypothetical protein
MFRRCPLTLLLEKCGRYPQAKKTFLIPSLENAAFGIDSQLVSFFNAFAKYKAGTTCVT